MASDLSRSTALSRPVIRMRATHPNRSEWTDGWRLQDWSRQVPKYLHFGALLEEEEEEEKRRGEGVVFPRLRATSTYDLAALSMHGAACVLVST